MMQPAMMIKTMPYQELLPIKALSDEDMDMANHNFRASQLPFRIIRECEQFESNAA